MHATLSPEPRDELDRRIDEVLDRVGQFIGFCLKALVLVSPIGFATWFVFFSPFAAAVQGPFLYVGLMLFQIMFAVTFIIVQLAALFWFLGRGRMYWLMLGESGVGFSDYKGNPEALELATRIVKLLQGVKAFREMGGAMHRGLLMIGPPGTRVTCRKRPRSPARSSACTV